MVSRVRRVTVRVSVTVRSDFGVKVRVWVRITEDIRHFGAQTL